MLAGKPPAPAPAEQKGNHTTNGPAATGTATGQDGNSPARKTPYPAGTPHIPALKPEGTVHKVHAHGKEKAPDLGKLCARGGTRTHTPFGAAF